VALRERVHAVLRGELERTLGKLNVNEGERQKLEAMCDAMVNKLLHTPLTELKQDEAGSDGANLVEAVQRLFGLAPSGSVRPPADTAAQAAEAVAGERSGKR
jgi:glutamyl-tRNA reductase